MNTLYTSTQMVGMAPEAQARRALLSILNRIRDHGSIGYHVGLGSNTFELLTEAYASLTGATVEEVRRTWECRAPTPPMEPVGFFDKEYGNLVKEIPWGEDASAYLPVFAEAKPW